MAAFAGAPDRRRWRREAALARPHRRRARRRAVRIAAHDHRRPRHHDPFGRRLAAAVRMRHARRRPPPADARHRCARGRHRDRRPRRRQVRPRRRRRRPRRLQRRRAAPRRRLRDRHGHARRRRATAGSRCDDGGTVGGAIGGAIDGSVFGAASNSPVSGSPGSVGSSRSLTIGVPKKRVIFSSNAPCLSSRSIALCCTCISFCTAPTSLVGS